MADLVWNEYELQQGAPPIQVSLGPLRVWIRYDRDEIWIGSRYAGAGADVGGNEEPPSDLDWARWAHSKPEPRITISPSFPNLPVVVNPEHPMTITPGAGIQIFTRIPVWMRIVFSPGGHLLKELPSSTLTKTWFGTPLEGELCFGASTRARRRIEDLDPKPYLVNCPVRIINRNSKDLQFEKFCFRVERLGIHRFGDALWASETQIVHQGGDSNSDITMTGKFPPGLGEGVKLSSPRHPLTSSLATRTFRKIFDDTFILGR